jgi:phosphoribosylformylglycinamidine cyclo-ligase
MTSAFAKIDMENDAHEKFVQLVQQRIAQAWPVTSKGVSEFSGGFTFSALGMKGRASVSGSDSAATLFALTKRFKDLGHNAAAESLMGVYTSGAIPVALLDVLRVADLDPELHIDIIDGLIGACGLIDPECRLVGGKTTEFPEMFAKKWMVNVDTVVIGQPVADLITRDVAAGQAVMGWFSLGVGWNGFSLVRKVFKLRGTPQDIIRRLDDQWPVYGLTFTDALLMPVPIWVPYIERLRLGGMKFAAHAHITRGGLVGSIPRILPEDYKVVINRNKISRVPLLGLIEETGKIPEEVMDRVFNQGISTVSIIDGSGKDPANIERGDLIGEVQKRKEGEPQVQFEGKFIQ